MNLHDVLKELQKLPNQLTLLRIILTFFLYAILFFYNHTLFVTVFILAGLTDILDGYFARKMNLASPFGSLLDTIADNFLHYSIFVWIFVLYPKIFFETLVWIIVMLGLVIIYSAICVLKHKRYFGLHTTHNKINAFLVNVFFLSLLVVGFLKPFFYILVASIIFAYVRNIYYLLNNKKIRLQ